jgi:hypothetical protein
MWEHDVQIEFKYKVQQKWHSRINNQENCIFKIKSKKLIKNFQHKWYDNIGIQPPLWKCMFNQLNQWSSNQIFNTNGMEKLEILNLKFLDNWKYEGQQQFFLFFQLLLVVSK